MLTEALINELKLQEKFGYFHLNQNRARFLLTWKGALIMTEKNVFPIKNILNRLDLMSSEKAIAGMPPPSNHTPGRPDRASGKEEAIGAELKCEERFKNGANWFFWIAALSLINSLSIRFGTSWNFIIGLGVTQIIDIIAVG